uniref:Enolase superfamily member 1 n=1 Tax=Rousettus aegyptiacus TaxID=9407 RepID=A0A7J8DGX3_ROUAE|nr:enolase superfamily member 1 [Rousettus aegyptiacus]
MNTDPDYSAAYVVLETDAEDRLEGYGITFTLGKGTEVGPQDAVILHRFQLCTEALKDGWTRFKVKVSADLHRCRLIRNMIGPEKTLMKNANQCWDVPEAVEWMSKLAEFKPLWTEEPTSPDDILRHTTISKPLVPLGIGIATGEQCHNRVIFKQLLQVKALQFLQIDSCRLGSVNENLSVLLMAKKFEIPVCPMLVELAFVNWCSI